MTDRLPHRASQRRIVVVLDGAEIDGGGDHVRKMSSTPHVQILSSQPDQAEADALTNMLERRGLLQPGHVLLLSPYDDNDYQLAEEAADAFSLQKFAAFIRTCQLIGARKTSIKAVQDLKSRERLEFTASGKYLKRKGSISAERGAVEDIASRLSWTEEFAGGEPDIEAAGNHLRERGLDRDIVLTSLVDSRADKKNPAKKRTITVDLSHEGSRTLNIAAGLDFGLAGLSANLKTVAEQSHRFTVTSEVLF